MFRTADTFRAEVEALTRQTITERQAAQVLAEIWPDKPDTTTRARAGAARRRDAVHTMYRSDPRVAGWHGTAYGLVQAASTWEQWHAPRRGDRGEQVLAAVLAGSRSVAADVADPRLTASPAGRRHRPQVTADRRARRGRCRPTGGGRVPARSAAVKPLVPRGRALRVDGPLPGRAARTGEPAAVRTTDPSEGDDT